MHQQCGKMNKSANSVILTVTLLLIQASLILGQNGEKSVDLVMPGAISTGKDSYRCSAFSLNDNGPTFSTNYITQFTANANASKAHHIILQKCKRPIKQPGQIWDCIHHSICRGETHIMYAWAKDAPPTQLPSDVAFKLDPDEYIVLQIHYADQFSEPDHTSVTVQTTPQKPKYFAGIYLLWLGYLVIPPAKDKVSGDMSCVSNIQPPMHVFAFRPHAHSLGRRVLGMIQNSSKSKTELFAVGDPQKPQAFYPLNETITVNAGDTLFARCVYNSMSKSKVTYIGSTAGDEMCNLYLMFYSEAEGQDFFTCGQNVAPKLGQVLDQKLALYDRNQNSEEVKDEPSKMPKMLTNMKPYVGHQFNFPMEKLGDICGIAYDVFGNIVVLNRGNHHWDGSTFNWQNEYNGDRDSPINMDTVVTLNSTGQIISSWGKDFFFMPHMITIDSENNVWITDVAMHQVFKFGPYGGVDGKPLIILGQKFQPGRDDQHYCKPTAVAVAQDARTFFVSDGYCNQRIIQYAIRSITSNGHHSVVKVMSFGASEIPNQPNGKWNPTVYNFNVPHSLTLVESMNLVCVADRENGLVQCFDLKNGAFQFTIPAISSFNGKIYSVHSSESTLAIIGGPTSASKSKLFLYDLKTHQSSEATINGPAQVNNPHDVAISEDGQQVVVANLKPNAVWVFENPDRKNYGKAIVEEVRMDTKQQKYLLPKSAQAPEGSTLWKTFGLIVVFVTGMAMIILYVRNRRRKVGDGFVPLNTKDDDEL